MDDCFLHVLNGSLSSEYLTNDDFADEYDSDNYEVEDEMECEDVDYKYRIHNTEEEQKILKFLSETCGCSSRNGSPCSNSLDFETLLSYRADMLQLTREEMDLIMLTAILISIDDNNVNVKGGIRKNTRCKMQFKGKQICLKTFLMLYAIGTRKFYALVSHFKETNSITPRRHGNAGRMPKHTLSYNVLGTLF